MDKLIVALFGINKVNFIGWVLTFLVLFVLALFLVAGALVPPLGIGLSAEVSLLAAACTLLAGIFGVLVQIYCSLMAVRIELMDGQSKSGNTTTNKTSEPDGESRGVLPG